MTFRRGSSAVRIARFELAKALAANQGGADEAIEQLDRAIGEPGETPAAWELQAQAGEVLRDVDPGLAIDRYVRALRAGAPDQLADEARAWVDSLRAGTIGASATDVDDLAGSTRTSATRLLAATVMRAQGRSEALDVANEIEAIDGAMAQTLRTLRVNCLIDMRRPDEAAQLLGDDVDQRDAAELLLRARVHLAAQSFVEALSCIDLMPQPRGDTVESLRSLCLIGLDRSDEVVPWGVDDIDSAGPETWLSRAVAALDPRPRAVGRSSVDGAALAREAALRAERWYPTSLSTMLIHAQTLLEFDELDAGHAVLVDLVKSVHERGRDPYWLEHQRTVRTDGRFQYFCCEYELAKNGTVALDALASVPVIDTSYAQDGRVAEMRADAVGAGPVQPFALADALNAYRRAGLSDRAADVGLRLLDVDPDLDRAISTGWAVYDATYLGGGVGRDVDDDVARLRRVVGEVHRQLELADGDVLGAVEVVSPLLTRLVELADGDRDLGLDALCWSFMAATRSADRANDQLGLDWICRRVFEQPAASLEIVGHASRLDPEVSVESRLIARANWFGSDAECMQLLDEIERSTSPDDVAELRWQDAVRLRLALLAGDRELTRSLMHRDYSEHEWSADVQIMAAIAVEGLFEARGLVERLRASLTGDASPVTLAWIDAALGAGPDRIEERLSAVAASGKVAPETIDDLGLSLRYIAAPQRGPLIEQLRKEIAATRSPAGLLILEHGLYPWMAQLTEPLDEAERAEFAAALAARRLEVDEFLGRWQVTLAAQDPRAGAFAALWQAVTRRDPLAVLLACDALEHVELSTPMRTGATRLTQAERERVPAVALAAVVRAIADGRAESALGDAMLGQAGVEAELVGALTGRRRLDTVEREHCEVLVAAAREAGLAGDQLWSLYEAAQQIGHGIGEALLEHLAATVGLHEGTHSSMRSHVCFVLGRGLVPEDTGPDWVLFSELIPALRRRIEDETGYRMPGFNVRGDNRGDPPGVLHLLLNEVIRESTELPVDGSLVPVAGAGPWTDPLTGAAVVRVAPGDEPPADGAASWTPLEFAMRHVEHFVRRHLAEVVTLWDVIDWSSERLWEDPAGQLDRLAQRRRSLAASVLTVEAR